MISELEGDISVEDSVQDQKSEAKMKTEISRPRL